MLSKVRKALFPTQIFTTCKYNLSQDVRNSSSGFPCGGGSDGKGRAGLRVRSLGELCTHSVWARGCLRSSSMTSTSVGKHWNTTEITRQAGHCVHTTYCFSFLLCSAGCHNNLLSYQIGSLPLYTGYRTTKEGAWREYYSSEPCRRFKVFKNRSWRESHIPPFCLWII